MTINLNELADIYHAELRTTGPDYIEFIESVFQYPVDRITTISQLLQSKTERQCFARALYNYYESVFQAVRSSHQIYREDPKTEYVTERYVSPRVVRFCAGTQIPLPPRRSSGCLLQFKKSDALASELLAALVSFEVVLIEDPLPLAFGWNDKWGIEGEYQGGVPHQRTAFASPIDKKALNTLLSWCQRKVEMSPGCPKLECPLV